MNPSRICSAAINAVTKQKHAQHLFKRSQTGIFHGRAIMFGKNVPEMGHRTPRTWMPNIRTRRLKSDILDRTMRWNVTTRAMRTINKYGSLDNYLLNTRTKWLGERAMWLRCRLRDELKDAEAAQIDTETLRSKTELEKASEKLVTSMPKSVRGKPALKL